MNAPFSSLSTNSIVSLYYNGTVRLYTPSQRTGHAPHTSTRTPIVPALSAL